MTYNQEYKKLIKHILDNGVEQNCRNGSQLIIPHYSFTIKNMMEDHTLLLRKMYKKGIYGEFLTLIDPKPLTNVSQFEANGCNYWSKWASNKGDLNLDYHNMLHPQLERIISNINKNPDSRRHHLELWVDEHINYVELKADQSPLSLPCCWHGLTFSVIAGTLHLKWTQRSVDTAVGLPSDVYLAYLFMSFIAIKTDLKVGSCMFSLSNVHLYSEHLTNARLLLTRDESDYNNPLSFELKE